MKNSERDRSTLNEALQVLEGIYDKSLKSTVKAVSKYFNIINNNPSLDEKTYIQLYILHLSPYNPQRIKAEKLNSYYSEIFFNLAKGNYYKLLTPVPEPKDELFNFSKILSSIDKRTIENNNNLINNSVL